MAAGRFGVGASRGEGDADPAFGFDDAGSDFEETEAERFELGVGEVLDLGDGVADSEHQPVGGGVQDQPDLIGER